MGSPLGSRTPGRSATDTNNRTPGFLNFETRIMNRKMLSRRTVLRGFGTALALPLLESMTLAAPLVCSSNIVRPSVVKPPVRMAFLYVPNGMNMTDWIPDKPGPDFTVPKILEPVAEFKDAMTIISGLGLDGAKAHKDGGGDHARSVAAFLTGAHPKKTFGTDIRNGKSVDQVAAEAIGDQTRFPSLELGTEESAPSGKCDSGYSCLYTSNISWRTDTSPLAKEINPANVFARLFGSSNATENRKALAIRERRKLSILDFVNDDAKSLQRTLGAKDQRKLDEYLYAVRSIEKQILSTDKLGEREEGVPDYPRPEGVPAEYEQHVKLLFDMMVLAFQTDSTRTISFMYTNAGSNRSYRNLGISSGHHNLSHHGGSAKKQKEIGMINNYHAKLLRHLLLRLSLVKEENGTLLDNCMIMYGSGIADGNSHRHVDLPISLFGKGGGTIQSGRHLKLEKPAPIPAARSSSLCQLKSTSGSTSMCCVTRSS